MLAQKNAEKLPVWNLKDFYDGLTDPDIKEDIAKAEKDSRSFAKKYKGNTASLSPKQFGEAIEEYERLQELIGKLACFSFLAYATNVENPEYQAFLKNTEEQISLCTINLIFFTLEVNKLEESHIKKLLSDPKVNHYQPWIRDIRVWRDYQLSEKEEELLHEKDLTSRSAWIKLFDQLEAGLRFPFKGESLSVAQIFDKFSSVDENERKLAAESIGAVLKDNSSTIAFIYNTIIKDKEIEDRKRKFEKPISSRNLSNLVEDEVVESLISTVKKNYANLSHRYYKIKAKMMGKKVLNYWDRNAPLSQSTALYSWEEAKQIVLNAYTNFSPQMGEIVQKFFDNNWIDAAPTPGKMSGAFSHGTVPSVHPYILLNYLGKARDVMTLAHELGHGVHQYLSRVQGVLMSDTPLTLAETASVFGEQLTFRSLLASEKDEKNRKLLVAGKIEDMLNTVTRQIAFCEFERRAHDARKEEGELSVEKINKIWMGIQEESFGDSIKLDDNYGFFWSYISHFFHTPFYVYAYAFGDCLVNSLYGVYQDKKVADFQGKYIEMLSAGGSKRYNELLKPFGLDPKDPSFWQIGLDKISSLIDMLEQ